MADLRVETKENHDESIANIQALKDALGVANEELADLRVETKENHDESIASIQALKGALGVANAKIAQLESKTGEIADTADGIAVAMEELEAWTEAVDTKIESPTLPLLPPNVTVVEAQEMLGECMAARFGALGFLVGEALTIDELVREFANEEGLSEEAMIRLVGVMFGCWN